MPKFQCKKCKQIIEGDYEICCEGTASCSGKKPPECCGQPMMEIMDD